jgi:hypothetical protein
MLKKYICFKVNVEQRIMNFVSQVQNNTPKNDPSLVVSTSVLRRKKLISVKNLGTRSFD